MLLLAGGVVIAIAVVVALVVLAGDDDQEPASPDPPRPAEAVTGSVLRPATGGGGGPVDGAAGSLSWRAGEGELVVLRDDRTILRADDPARFREVAVRPIDVDGDGAEELVALFRGAGSAGLLEVDVVSADGDVVLHHEADKGVARVGPTVVEVFAARFAADDPNCCPSAYERRVVESREGVWLVRTTGEVPADEVPASDL